MPSTCPNCGVVLPKENARFCNKCGWPVSSRAVNDAQQEQFDAGRAAGGRAGEASAWHEMGSSQAAPSTATYLDRAEQGEMGPPSFQQSMQGRRNGERTGPSARKLRIRLWEEGDGMPTSTLTERAGLLEASGSHAPVFPEESVPSSAGRQVAQGGGEQAFASKAMREEYREHIAQFDTMQLPAALALTSLPTSPLGGSNGAASHSQLVATQGRRAAEESGAGHNAQFAMAAAPASSSAPGTVMYAPEHAGQAPQAAAAAAQLLPLPGGPAGARKQRRGRLLMAIGLAMALLAVGGIGAWVVIAQPFNVPAVTQPQQRFRNNQLGVTLLYPSGWTLQVEQSGASVTFNDSSHVAQMTLSADADSIGNAGQYVQQEASKLGMTAVKTEASVTCAGTSWQVVQGNVLVKGATYTETLLGTQHGGKVYTLFFAAPQATYASEDNYIFSTMRSSLQFLA